MKRSIPRLAALSLLAFLCACPSSSLRAQNTNSAKAAKTEAKPHTGKKPSAGPFNGKLVSVDKAAKTIMVGKRTFYITAETRLNKDGKPATLSDAIVGEVASGYVKPAEDGRLIATTVNFGPKPKTAEKGSPKETPAKK